MENSRMDSAISDLCIKQGFYHAEDVASCLIE